MVNRNSSYGVHKIKSMALAREKGEKKASEIMEIGEPANIPIAESLMTVEFIAPPPIPKE